MNLLEAAMRMAAAARDLDVAEDEVVRVACQMVAGRAKLLIGVPHGWWPPLQPETIARKDGVNTPLLETGEMRDSIEWVAEGSVGHVGSNDDKAVWQELGTSHIPPRSFLGAAAMLEGPSIAKVAAEAIGEAIAGRMATGHAVKDLIHLMREVKHAAHDLGEFASDVVGEDGKKN